MNGHRYLWSCFIIIRLLHPISNMFLKAQSISAQFSLPLGIILLPDNIVNLSFHVWPKGLFRSNTDWFVSFDSHDLREIQNKFIQTIFMVVHLPNLMNEPNFLNWFRCICFSYFYCSRTKGMWNKNISYAR